MRIEEWIKVQLAFTEPLLATRPGEPEICKEYIMSQYPQEGLPEDELAAQPKPDEVLEKASTLFSLNNGIPVLWDYQIKGFFKETVSAIRRIKAKTSLSKVEKEFKKYIDCCIFIRPRMIPLCASAESGWLQRPLRANGPQGERIALARSQMLPAGTTLTLEVGLYDPKIWSEVSGWLDMGEYHGLGQWRNASYGRFTWKVIQDE